MKIVKMFELAPKDACQHRREFDYYTESKKNAIFDKAAVTKGIIHDYFEGNVDFTDVPKKLHENFDLLPYKSAEQKEVHEMEVLRQVMRYIQSETRNPIPAPVENVELTDELTVITTPDFYFYNYDKSGKKTLEVVKIKCAKPNLTQKDAHKDLGLLSVLKYADNLAKKLGDPNIVTVKASFYWLAKKNDSYSTEKPVFEKDFFKTTGGLNVVSILDDVGIPSYLPIIEDRVAEYMLGIPAHECTDSDCAECNLKSVCKYTEPPIAIVKEPVVKSLAMVSLTPSQQEAIDVTKGIYRINAGAGAGKTMVIAMRVATLLDKGVKPEEIFLVTFTNSGAEEMRTRIKLYIEDFDLDVDVNKIRIQTFNAFGDDIIKKEYAKLGFSEPPAVIDDVERSHIIAELLNKAVKDPFYDAYGNPVKNPLKSLNWRSFTSDTKYAKGALTIARNIFAVMKANGYTPADFDFIKRDIGADYRFIPSNEALMQVALLYREYEEYLRNENLVEFADQEGMVFEIIHDDPYYFENFGFRHIIVDEFQDTSQAQIDMLRLFVDCPTFESLMVVGDDSQSIFGFRDTSPEYIINFEEHIGSKINDVYLVENHRSTPEIIEFANKLNEKNIFRVPKTLISTRPSGKPVICKGFLTPQEEEEWVLDNVKTHIDNGTDPADIAIICYTKYELRKMAGLLEKAGIPSVMLNPEPLLENSRVQAAIALINALHDPSDTTDMLVFANAKLGGGIMDLDTADISSSMDAVKDFIVEYYDKDTDGRKEALMEQLRSIDFNQDEIYQKFLETLERKNLMKLYEYVEEFELYGSNTAIRRDHDYPGVVLTTAHSSKGLEWPVCFNMISKYDTQELPKRTESVEERRRLLFVSCTRARDELYITGQYVAYGKKGDYTYNKFLVESYEITGQVFSVSNIETEREMRRQLAEQKRKEEKEAKKAEKEKQKAESQNEMQASA